MQKGSGSLDSGHSMKITPKNGLTLTFGDRKKNLSVDALRSALEHALEMLQSMEADFVSAGTAVRWEVASVRMQSPLTVTFAPRVHAKGGAAIGRRMIKAAVYDLAAIERNGVAPAHMNETGLRAVQKLAVLSQSEDAPLRIGGVGMDKKSQVTLTKRASKRVDEIVERAHHYIDFLTIEGKMEMVSVHGGTSFVVWETLTNNKIDCVVTPEQFQQWKELLGKRVALTGRVHYRNHVARSINVESIIVLRDASQLPQPKDIVPINITDGLPSEEHVRRVRDA